MTLALLPVTGGSTVTAVRCKHDGAYLGIHAGNNGIVSWCADCRDVVTIEKYGIPFLGKDHAAVRGKPLDTLPVVGRQEYKQCNACRETLICELHHFAPRAFFGEACDSWPMGWLCKGCHALWHTKVTPGLCTAYDADAHALMLFGYLSHDNIVRLWNAIKKLGTERRRGAS